MRARRCLMLLALIAVPAVAPSGARATDEPPSMGAPDGGPRLDAAPPGSPKGHLYDWRATPGDVAGGAVYDGAELVLTDYPFDDRGADTDGDDGRTLNPLEKYSLTEGANAANATSGDYRYPPEDVFESNAADIVEVRVAADEDAWYLLVILNALLDPERTAVEARLQHENLDVAPVTLLVHGIAGSIDGVTVAADAQQNTIEARIPRSVYDPGEATHDLFVAAGLWNPAAGDWLDPDPATGAAPYFDLALTDDEGWDSYWRETEQSRDIASGDFSRNQIEVDFARLADPCEICPPPVFNPRQRCRYVGPVLWCPPGPPGSPTTRVFRSGQLLGEGVVPQERYDQDTSSDYKLYRSRYQPYSLYVGEPKRPGPQPLVLLLHFLGGNHMSYPITSFGRGLAGRAASVQRWADELGVIVAMPLGRGEAGWYEGEAEKDVFEVWRDVAQHYPVDRERVYLMGMSMGGYGTWRLASLYPDQFAKAIVWSGPVTPYSLWFHPAPLTWPQQNPPMCDGDADGCGLNLMSVFGNAVNVPTMVVHGGGDELVPSTGTEHWMQAYDAAGGPYRYVLYPTRRHETSYPGSTGDWVTDWLLDSPARVPRPSRVRYTVVRDLFQPDHGLTYDGAYWLDDVALREGAREGTIEASLAHDPAAAPIGPMLGADALGPYRLTGRAQQVTLARGTELRLASTGMARATVEDGVIQRDPHNPLVIHATTDGVQLTIMGEFLGASVAGAPFEILGDRLVLSLAAGDVVVTVADP